MHGLNWSCDMFGLCPLEVFSSLGEKCVCGGELEEWREGKLQLRYTV